MATRFLLASRFFLGRFYFLLFAEARESLELLVNWCDLCLPANEQAFAEAHRIKLQHFQARLLYFVMLPRKHVTACCRAFRTLYSRSGPVFAASIQHQLLLSREVMAIV